MLCDRELHQELQGLLTDSLRACDNQFRAGVLQQAADELRLHEFTELIDALLGPAPGEPWELRLARPD